MQQHFLCCWINEVVLLSNLGLVCIRKKILKATWHDEMECVWEQMGHIWHQKQTIWQYRLWSDWKYEVWRWKCRGGSDVNIDIIDATILELHKSFVAEWVTLNRWHRLSSCLVMHGWTCEWKEAWARRGGDWRLGWMRFRINTLTDWSYLNISQRAALGDENDSTALAEACWDKKMPKERTGKPTTDGAKKKKKKKNENCIFKDLQARFTWAFSRWIFHRSSWWMWEKKLQINLGFPLKAPNWSRGK